MWFNKLKIEKGLHNWLNGKKWIIPAVLLLSLPLIYGFGPHPYHVSYTEIEYKKADNTLTFSIEVFTDDLENAIKIEYQPEKFLLGSDTLSVPEENLVQSYIKENLTIILDGVVMKGFDFLPTESNPDRTIVYFQMQDLPPFDGLTFYSEILTSLFKDQQNIVEYKRGEQKVKALLTNEKKNVTWKNE